MEPSLYRSFRVAGSGAFSGRNIAAFVASKFWQRRKGFFTFLSSSSSYSD
jgi:hypothetical protein